MTSEIFEEWLWKWDTRLSRSKRKKALFVDNWVAHPYVLRSIQLIFLPPNTTSEIQPCDQGIIKALKVHYRKNMVKHFICAINSGSTVIDFNITHFDGPQMLKKAWELVTESTVSNCYCKAGFVQPLEPEIEEDSFLDFDEETPTKDDPLLQLAIENTCSFDDYVAVDNELQCAPLPTNKDIVFSFRQILEEAGKSDDNGDPLPPVTQQQAYFALQELRSYLLRSSQEK